MEDKTTRYVLPNCKSEIREYCDLLSDTLLPSGTTDRATGQWDACSSAQEVFEIFLSIEDTSVERGRSHWSMAQMSFGSWSHRNRSVPGRPWRSQHLVPGCCSAACPVSTQACSMLPATLPILKRIPLRIQKQICTRRNSSQAMLNELDATTYTETNPPGWELAKPYRDIPGPRPFPFVGNVWRFLPIIGDLHHWKDSDFITQLHKRYGTIVKFEELLPGYADYVFVGDADDIETSYRNEGPCPHRRPLQAMKYYADNHLKVNVSLGTSQGEEWRDFRKDANWVMMHPKNAKSFTEPINIVSEEFIQRILDIRDAKGQMPEDFLNEISKFSLETLAYLAMDKRLGTLRKDLPATAEAQKLIESIHTVFYSFFHFETKPTFWKLLNTPDFRKFMDAMDFVQEVTSAHINRAWNNLKGKSYPEQNRGHTSVLESILLRTGDPNKAEAMSRDMMLAGGDTLPSHISAAMYHIAKNPEKQRLLQKEVDSVLPDPAQPVTADQLEQMKYLRACIKEAGRLHTVFSGQVRTTCKNTVLNGYQVPRGTNLILSTVYTTKDKRYFPRPDEFLPERWMPEAGHLKPKHPFAHLPFSFGPRMCVGKRIADYSTEIFLAKLLRRCSLQWNQPPPETAVRLFLYFSSPLKFTVIDRV